MTDPVMIGQYRLSPEFFTKTRLTSRCLTQCANECCNEGSWVTLYEARQIIARRDEIQPYLEQPYDFDTWDLSRPGFLHTPVLDKETPDQRCWFFTTGRRCALHSLALDKGIPLKAIKPYFCSLFPLTLVDIQVNETEIAIDAKAYDTCLVQGDKETWLYTQFEPDLRRVLGNEVYAELQRRYPE